MTDTHPRHDQERPSPSRKRSRSEALDTTDYNGGAESPALAYAYDEDGGSDAAASTPRDDGEEGVERAEGDGDAHPKRLKLERPKSLNYKPHLTLRGHARGVSAAKFSPNGKWIASCSADCTIKIWEARTGRIQHTLEGHLAGVSTIAWSPDSKVVASGSDDKLIRLWDVGTGKCLQTTLEGHHNYVYSIAFSPKGNMLVSGSYDEAVFLWDVRTARVMRSLPAHSDPVSGVDFVRDGTLVASCSTDGLIRIWDTGTGQCLKTLVHEDNSPVTSVRFSPNGKFVLACTLDSCVRLWNYVEGRCLKTYQGHKNQKYSIATCFGTYGAEASVANGTDREDNSQQWAFAACGSEDGKVVLWDVNSKEVLQVLQGHDEVVLGVDVGLEDQTILTCGLDKTIKIWKRRAMQVNGHAANGTSEEKEQKEDTRAHSEDQTAH